jgi:hypothetical protein
VSETATTSAVAKEAARVSTYVTGWCQSGACEGTKKKSDSGQVFPSCRGVYYIRGGSIKVECTHKCHADARRLRELMGLPDPEPVDSFAVPSTRVTGLQHTVRDEAAAVDDALERPDIRAMLGQRDATPTINETASGRLAKGQLEDRVYQICKMGPNLEVRVICVFVGTKFGGDVPSPGAVTAVLERWARAGLAEIDYKPTRFVKFSDEVERDGLWAVKDKINRAASRASKGFF